MVFVGGMQQWYVDMILPDTRKLLIGDYQTTLSKMNENLTYGMFDMNKNMKRDQGNYFKYSSYCCYDESYNNDNKKSDRFMYVTWGNTLEVFKIMLKEFPNVNFEKIETFC